MNIHAVIHTNVGMDNAPMLTVEKPAVRVVTDWKRDDQTRSDPESPPIDLDPSTIINRIIPTTMKAPDMIRTTFACIERGRTVLPMILDLRFS